jgi:hypothetical protein
MSWGGHRKGYTVLVHQQMDAGFFSLRKMSVLSLLVPFNVHKHYTYITDTLAQNPVSLPSDESG